MSVIIYLSMTEYMHVSKGKFVREQVCERECFMLVIYLVVCATKSALGVCVFYLNFLDV